MPKMRPKTDQGQGKGLEELVVNAYPPNVMES